MIDDDVEVEYSESILELADKVIGSKNSLSLGGITDQDIHHLLIFLISIFTTIN